MSAPVQHPPRTPHELFGRILCVTDLSTAGAEAVRQAAVLAGPGGAIDLVSVAPERPPGMPRPQAAQIEALVVGTSLASTLEVACTTHIAEAMSESAGVLPSCADHDVVVVPAGDTAIELLSGACVSVLVSRQSSTGSRFPESIVVAVDGSDEAHAAARLGAKLAVQHDATLALVATPEHDATHQNALERDIRAVERITGTRPVVLDEYRGPVPSILSAAASVDASLIVVGRRSGSPSPSVSAEVAGAAPCSVFVVRPG